MNDKRLTRKGNARQPLLIGRKNEDTKAAPLRQASASDGCRHIDASHKVSTPDTFPMTEKSSTSGSPSRGSWHALKHQSKNENVDYVIHEA